MRRWWQRGYRVDLTCDLRVGEDGNARWNAYLFGPRGHCLGRFDTEINPGGRSLVIAQARAVALAHQQGERHRETVRL